MGHRFEGSTKIPELWLPLPLVSREFKNQKYDNPKAKKFDQSVAFAARFTAYTTTAAYPGNVDYTRFSAHPACSRLLCPFDAYAGATGYQCCKISGGKRVRQQQTHLQDH